MRIRRGSGIGSLLNAHCEFSARVGRILSVAARVAARVEAGMIGGMSSELLTLL